MSQVLDWTDEELEAAGLDRRRVESIVRRLRRISREMTGLGLHIYGASSTGHLMHHSRPSPSTGHLMHHSRPSPSTGHLMHHSRPSHAIGGRRQDWNVIADVGEGFTGGDW